MVFLGWMLFLMPGNSHEYDGCSGPEVLGQSMVLSWVGLDVDVMESHYPPGTGPEYKKTRSWFESWVLVKKNAPDAWIDATGSRDPKGVCVENFGEGSHPFSYCPAC